LPYFPNLSITETQPLFPYNSPSWSLFFEFFVNALFALTLFKYRIKWLYVTIALSLLWLIAYIFFYKTSTPGWGTSNFFGGFPRVIYSFSMGVLLIEFIRKIKTRESNFAPLLIIASLAIALLVRHMNGYFWLASVAILVPLFVYAGAVVKFQSQNMRSVANYLGMVSYPIYCLHIPLQGVTAYIIGEAYPVLSTLTSTAAVFLVSHFLARYFEPSWPTKIKQAH
jgi:peptidoglycan/LPS O-acetylase OafA/YrhL